MDLSSYDEVRKRMADAAQRSGRDPSSVTLVAVSKGHGEAAIRSLYELGHRDFGENRAAEMAEKAAVLPSDIRWHFVGNLQSRKAREIRAQTHLLHSMDRPSLAKAWLKGLGPPPPVLLQVNIGREEQKGGAAPEVVEELARKLGEMGIAVKGLMAIPPLGDVPEASRGYFTELRSLAGDLGAEGLVGEELSMGMTNDFEVAIEEGASIIRVGRAIFDPTDVQG